MILVQRIICIWKTATLYMGYRLDRVRAFPSISCIFPHDHQVFVAYFLGNHALEPAECFEYTNRILLPWVNSTAIGVSERNVKRLWRYVAERYTGFCCNFPKLQNTFLVCIWHCLPLGNKSTLPHPYLDLFCDVLPLVEIFFWLLLSSCNCNCFAMTDSNFVLFSHLVGGCTVMTSNLQRGCGVVNDSQWQFCFEVLDNLELTEICFDSNELYAK